MANAFTRFAPTPYQSQYTPIPFEQIVPVMQDASARRQASQLADARSKKLVSAIGAQNDPEAQEFVAALENRVMENISQRAQRGYSSQDAIETGLLAEETAAAVGSLQSAQQARDEWEKEYREANKDINPADLETFIRYRRPQITYDKENLRANISSAPIDNLAKDLDTLDFMNKAFQGVKDEEIGEPVYTTDPITGKVKLETVRGIPQERVEAIIGSALRSDPEARNYLDRKEQMYYLQANENDPVDLLNRYAEAMPNDATKTKARARINQMLNNGEDPAAVYARMMRSAEALELAGLATNKYGGLDIEREFISIDEKTRQGLRDRHMQSKARLNDEFNNPLAMSAPDDLGSITHRGSKKGENPTWYSPYGDTPASDRQVPVESVEDLIKARPDMQDVLSDLQETFPRRTEEGETAEQYLDRINERYRERKAALTTFGGYYEEFDLEEGKEIREAYLGDKNQKNLGRARGKTFSVVTDDQGLVPMTYEQLADLFGYSDINKFKAEVIDSADIIGRYNGDNPLSPSGLYMKAYGKIDTWGFDEARDHTIMIHENDVFTTQENTPLMKLSQLKMSPVKESHTVNVGGSDVEFYKKHEYVIEEPGKPHRTIYSDSATPEELSRARYSRPILAFKDDEGNEITEENDPQNFNLMLEGIRSYGQ